MFTFATCDSLTSTWQISKIICRWVESRCFLQCSILAICKLVKIRHYLFSWGSSFLHTNFSSHKTCKSISIPGSPHSIYSIMTFLEWSIMCLKLSLFYFYFSFTNSLITGDTHFLSCLFRTLTYGWGEFSWRSGLLSHVKNS